MGAGRGRGVFTLRGSAGIPKYLLPMQYPCQPSHTRIGRPLPCDHCLPSNASATHWRPVTRKHYPMRIGCRKTRDYLATGGQLRAVPIGGH